MTPNWNPLETRLGPERCVGFMYMGRVNGINLYKHGIARMYLNLDDAGACYVDRGNGTYELADFAVELAKIKAVLAELDETLESVYDDAYKARKEKALRVAGISLLRIEVGPENRSLN
ncbi:MAG: hypothetical protein L0387_25105 [Acidobacteria bacterium]|nr:hypothetical protein [Acidobacteriota bacterium]MCI0717732.1 hypothetical protein [Acidobacteriota bacterium]